MAKAPEIPCFFHNTICPQKCELYQTNMGSLENILASLQSISGQFKLKDVIALMRDPDQEIGSFYNTLLKNGTPQKEADQFRTGMYGYVNSVSEIRENFARQSNLQDHCLHNKK